MWEKLYNALSTLVTIGVKVERHEKEIETLKAENRQLAAILHEVLAELRNVSQHRESDRRTIELFIENQLLKFEKKLPAVKENDKRKSK